MEPKELQVIQHQMLDWYDEEEEEEEEDEEEAIPEF